MRVVCTGVAEIEEHGTGKVHKIDCSELHFDEVDVTEREMGPETTHEAEVDHPVLGTLTWTIWEYPPGAQNHKEHNVRKHTVISDFNLSLK